MSEKTLIPAAGYVRVSTDKQDDGFSPAVQQAAIDRYARDNGYEVVLWERDAASGHKVTREGYKALLGAVERKEVAAVIVNTFDRFGRDGVEWLTRAYELERRDVAFISVQEGRDQDDAMRYLRPYMGREYSKNLAKKVRPAMERSVREGQHIGITPWGFKRVYPEHVGAGRYQAGLLTPVEPAASIVRELFDRAAVGWPLRALAAWMNDNPECPRPDRAESWTADRVGYMLHNPTYAGNVQRNRHRVGKFDRSKPGEEFTVPGRHGGIITQELFDRVQARIEASNRHHVRTRIARPVPLAAGMLTCAGCGGPMTMSRRVDGSHADQYVCNARHMGSASCTGAGYVCDLAHDALLAQVARLTGSPWQPQALERLIEADPTEGQRADLAEALRDAEAELQRHIKRFSVMVEDPTERDKAAFKGVLGDINARMKGLETAIAALPVVAVTAGDLAALHRELAHVSIGDVVAALVGAGDNVGLRDLVIKLVGSAQVVERLPVIRSRWLRAEVTWAHDVQLLIDAGLLTLAADVTRPEYPDNPIDARRARQLAYYYRKKAATL